MCAACVACMLAVVPCSGRYEAPRSAGHDWCVGVARPRESLYSSDIGGDIWGVAMANDPGLLTGRSASPHDLADHVPVKQKGSHAMSTLKSCTWARQQTPRHGDQQPRLPVSCDNSLVALSGRDQKTDRQTPSQNCPFEKSPSRSGRVQDSGRQRCRHEARLGWPGPASIGPFWDGREISQD